MDRRLYFLIPDAEHCMCVINDLRSAGKQSLRFHIKTGSSLDAADLPAELQDIHGDWPHQLERILWNTNLGVFFAALFVLFIGLLTSSVLTIAGSLAVMLVTFLAGLAVTLLPDVPIHEFEQALRHREVLLMVDTPMKNVASIEQRVHRYHPEAVAGGVSWNWRFGGT
ncbi:MAG TPA: hypothetical protein ENI64_13280 [Gammaproteobacteria bacterium]|nr:hypothetical protein [Gammaproteobacteria bacterium]